MVHIKNELLKKKTKNNEMSYQGIKRHGEF